MAAMADFLTTAMDNLGRHTRHSQQWHVYVVDF